MFTDLYLLTTNPNLSLYELVSPANIAKIIMVAGIHALIYASAFNAASFVFSGKPLNYQVNIRLVLLLLFIMIFGYFARFYHVKDVYNAYNKDMNKTRAHLDQLYIGWIFIA